ncbi:MAG: hypothetical protein ACKKMS_03215 [Candidatus Nealsonbacteria bacterium]
MTRVLWSVKLSVLEIGGLVAKALAKAAGKQTSNFLVLCYFKKERD